MNSALAQRDYYTIEESLKILQESGISFTEKDLEHYGEVEKLKFSVNVKSRPAYAAKYNCTTREMLFIGHCNLNGIFALRKGDLCGIMSSDPHPIKLLDGHPLSTHIELNQWSTTLPKDAQLAGLNYEKLWAPETYSADLKYIITFFYLRPEIYLHLKEGLPGSVFPLNLIPENILNDAIKFNLGSPKQWPENQIFEKSDLRITKTSLADFIIFLNDATLQSKKPKEQDKRTTDQSEALAMLAKHAQGMGLGYTAFAKLLKEHSRTEPYEGYEGCNNIYLNESKMHFTFTSENGERHKRSIDITSMKYHFKKIKKQNC